MFDDTSIHENAAGHRFCASAGPRLCAPGTLRFDQALDRLGKRVSPDEWLVPYNKEPLFRTDDGGFKMPCQRLRRQIRYCAFAVDGVTISELERLVTLQARLATELRIAIYSGDIKASRVSWTGELHSLKKSALVVRYPRYVRGAGVVPFGRCLQSVWIDRRSFQSWLGERAPRVKARLPRQLAAEFVEAFTAFSRSERIKFPRSALLALVNYARYPLIAFKSDLESNIVAELPDDVRSSGGRPSDTEAKKIDTLLRPKLRELVKALEGA